MTRSWERGWTWRSEAKDIEKSGIKRSYKSFGLCLPNLLKSTTSYITFPGGNGTKPARN